MDTLLTCASVSSIQGNCEEQLPLTDCRSTVGRQITDTLPTGHRQSTDRLPTFSQNRNFTVKLSSKHRSKPDTESDESRKTSYFIVLRYLRNFKFIRQAMKSRSKMILSKTQAKTVQKLLHTRTRLIRPRILCELSWYMYVM